MSIRERPRVGDEIHRFWPTLKKKNPKEIQIALIKRTLFREIDAGLLLRDYQLFSFFHG
jgi:hypothetical protein